MRNLGVILLSVGFLVINGCQQCANDYPQKTFHSTQQGHDYDSSQEGTVSLQPNDPYYDSPNPKKNYEGIRDIWQRPEVVIDRLGDLTGKVVADVGAGPLGYFALRIAGQTNVTKVIAIDLDQEALDFISEANNTFLPEDRRDRIVTRLASENDPNLKTGEADIVLIVNLIIYFDDRKAYFEKLMKGMKKGGRLVLVDFKKKKTPHGPPVEKRLSLGQIEQELADVGYNVLPSDDKSLEFQYVITAVNTHEN